jgi:release factor glutamine methyltransferase
VTDLDRATALLRAAGLEEPRAEARALLRAVPVEQLEAALQRRAAGMPLSRILGQREFWSLDFRLNEATLDPRPDSETLVEAVLGELPDRNRAWRLLDLGTGSGCLLLALLSELPAATGVGIDLAPTAVRQAAANARALDLAGRAQFLADDWGRSLVPGFDVVLSNPPYVRTAVLASLGREVAEHDPRLALDGGADGLDAYRALLPQAVRLLRPGGLLALEIGFDQEGAVEDLFRAQGLRALACRRDLAGRPRVWLARSGTEQARRALWRAAADPT